MTREMGQIDTVDRLTNTAFEPIPDPLHAGEPQDESRIKEVRDTVNWAKRLTYNADGVSQKAIDAIVNSRSAGIVGENPYTGETDVALATPQFTANTEDARRKVEKSIRSRLKVVINNASRSRLITPEKADRLIDEVPVRTLGLRFQPHKEPRPFIKEPERKNVYSGYTRNEQVISGPKKAILVIAGSSFLLSSCAVVPTAVETAVATATQSVDVPIGVPTESPKSTSQAEKTPTPDISETPSGPEIADALDVANYQIIDGNIQEKRGNAWQEVGVPYEQGYIAYVEIHDGKAYGIDTADRAVVVRNDETGEWEKFDRPIFGADFDNYSYDDGVLKQTLSLDTSGLDMTDVPASDIKMMTDNEGNTVKWGFVGDKGEWATDIPMFFYTTSGYFLGEVKVTNMHYWAPAKNTWRDSGPLYSMFVFEVPHKYYRQIFLIDQGDPSGQTLIMTGQYPDVKESFNVPMSNIIDSLPELRGVQAVTSFGIYSAAIPGQKLWETTFNENYGYSYNIDVQAAFFWFSSDFPINKLQ